MGLEDRDWWREAQRRRRAAGAEDARPAGGRRAGRTARRGALGIVVFWLAVMGLLYLAMQRVAEPKRAQVTADGAIVIPRHADGHFRVSGAVNGEPVRFLVDTGASLVSVSDGLALRAGLRGGEPATFRTANGTVAGTVVRGATVAVRGATVANLRIGTGLDHGRGAADDEALLGQNFLQQFDLEIGRDRMVLRPRP
ncbi:retropepsin-like aspartic protease family protein [Xylophilus sp.]|uniref:retropepsin-like aspartic protease family protein n=1 Tax=Xylophilus sp. TaxID=2653893 RepID=UPI0013B7DE5C|nr:TIGR02281 family clan AA aspartic protease [Xylophilus sp.]KAF1047783.1 MAG: hypothetical protein GAK38_01726 [Xylophilus sp.]